MSGFAEFANASANVLDSVNGLASGTPGSVVPTSVTTNTTSTSDIDQTELINQLIAELTKTTGSQTTAGTVTTDNLTALQNEQLQSGLNALMAQINGDSPFSQEAARAASAEAMSAAIGQTINQGIGTVANSGVNNGAYNSTVTGKLGSQLGAEAAKAGAQVQLDTLTKYGALDNQYQAQLMNDLNALLTTAGLTSGTVANNEQIATTQVTDSSQQTTANNSTNQTSTTDTNTQQDSEYAEVGKQQGVLSGIDDFVSGLF